LLDRFFVFNHPVIDQFTVLALNYIFSDFAATLLFSIWLSFLTILPISLSCDGSIQQILTLFFEQNHSNHIQEYLLWSAYGSAFGSWFGAFVIPLDWDRWW
jgi:hypothetical protein